MSSVKEIKTFVRDINLTLLSTSKKVDIDISKRYCDKIGLFMPNRKLIKYVTDVWIDNRKVRGITYNSVWGDLKEVNKKILTFGDE